MHANNEQVNFNYYIISSF